MMESIPVVPPQPERETYGPFDLALFQNYDTRERYVAKFGAEPPPFDPNLRPKHWFDSTAPADDPEADVTYRVIKQTKPGVYQVVTTMMPAWEARRVNIPATLESGVGPTHPEFEGRGRPLREIPVRELLPNEALTAGFGGLAVIVRLDLQRRDDEQSGKFLPTDRDLLHAIARKVGV